LTLAKIILDFKALLDLLQMLSARFCAFVSKNRYHLLAAACWRKSGKERAFPKQKSTSAPQMPVLSIQHPRRKREMQPARRLR